MYKKILKISHKNSFERNSFPFFLFPLPAPSFLPVYLPFLSFLFLSSYNLSSAYHIPSTEKNYFILTNFSHLYPKSLSELHLTHISIHRAENWKMTEMKQFKDQGVRRASLCSVTSQSNSLWTLDCNTPGFPVLHDLL